MPTTRRRYLAGAATLLSAAGLGATVIAQEAPPAIAFVEIAAEAEYIVIRNVSDGEVDLSGYNVNLEVRQEVDQIPDEPFPDGTTLDAGDTLTIATGSESDVEGDVDLGYEAHMINDENPDTIGILNPSGEVVIRSDDDDHFVSDDVSTAEPTSAPTDTPTPEPTDTPTLEPASESTGTSTSEPDAPADEPTDTPAPEPTETATPEPTDADCDGLVASEEAQRGTDSNEADTDGDGWSDRSEVNRDSDPLDPSSHP